MTQNPTNLQEPSMDELLASIREIIEESSAATETEESMPVNSLENNGAGEVLTMDFDKKDFDERPKKTTQEDAITHAALPIHDAMKALAARIGLKKPASETEKTPIPSSPLAFNPVTNAPAQPVVPPPAPAPLTGDPKPVPTNSSTATVVRPFPSGQISVAAPPKTVPGTTARSLSPTAAVPPPQISSSPDVQAQIPLSLSVQASTHSASNLPPLKKQNKPQTKAPSNAPLPAGHIPLYPQFHAMPTLSVQPALGQTASKSTDPKPSISANPISSKSESATSMPEGKRELNAFEQGFLAEFEQSAELLLRPYIAAWLEEHFQNLFEKILREEIQRLMQKNLRR